MATVTIPARTAARRGLSERVAAVYVYLPALLLFGFGLRVSFLLSNVYHPDEFITMLAAKMVAQRGLPILPSGLFYDHGLLYSLLSGGLVALTGFSEPIARWPALLAGTVTLAVYYAAARRLFSTSAGLLAATLVALDELTLKWHSWARMYSLAHLFVLLTLALLLALLFRRSGRYTPYLLLLCLAGAALSHTLTLFILPPLALLSLVFIILYRRAWLHSRPLWGGLGLALAILLGVLAVVAVGQVSSTASFRESGTGPAPFGLEFLRGFILPGLEAARFSRFIKFFLEPPYNLLLAVIGPVLLAGLHRLGRRTPTPADQAILCLALFIVLVILEMGVLLAPEWRKGIYMFLLTLPAFLLLGAASLARLLEWLAAGLFLLSGRGRFTPGVWPGLGGLLLIAAIQGPAAWDTAHGQTTGDYNTAFAYVREHWQPGDRVMTEHPAAAYLYLEQNDYYANQVTAKVLEEGDETAPIDRYTGSPLVDTVEALNRVLAGGHRVWLVVGTDHLNKYYDSLFHQQIFAQMDLVRQTGEKYVFLSRPFPAPVPAQPTGRLEATFGDFVRLEGYSLDLSRVGPDSVLPLALYWRPINRLPGTPFKVFVQLRNGQGQTVAQADHFIWEGLLTGKRWDRLREEGNWLRDTADLALPLPLPAEGRPYRIYVGLYHPETFERVPVANDTSGENAAVIDFP